MRVLAIALGTVGCIFITVPSTAPLALLLLMLGALMFLSDVRKQRTALEERRHKEMMEAMRQSKRE